MTRQLTITAAEWASRGEEGRLWLVREGVRWGTAHLEANAPPAEFVQACAPCENEDITCHCGCEGPCNACRIELVGPCYGDPWCYGCERGHVLGHAYAVGEPLPIIQDPTWVTGSYVDPKNELQVCGDGKILHVWKDDGRTRWGCVEVTGRLAHAGPPELLVDKWALQLAVVGS